nr:metallopeptidase [Colletotrichum truncatum]KAF6784849.1 metallopeptidase [Colletotrichum truncatum]
MRITLLLFPLSDYSLVADISLSLYFSWYLATDSEACFHNVVQPLIDVENQTDGDIKVIAMLRYASPDPKAREASEEAVRLLGECDSEFTAREDLFILIKAVHDRGEALDPEAVKYLDNLVQSFRRCGHGLLSRPQLKQYLTTRNQIDELRRESNRSIREEEGGVWFALEDLDGVPGDALARFQHGTESGQDGMRYVHFRKAEGDSVLKYATKSSTREKMYTANAHRLPENVDLFKRIIKLRDQNARLLGYSSHASLRLERRVAKSVEWVSGLFEGLEKAFRRKGKGGANLENYLEIVTPWDYAFYTRLALEGFTVDHAKVSEFFPLRHAIQAILSLFSSFLQLRFVPAPPELVSGSMWHEDVEAWGVWEEREAQEGEFIGYLFMDLLWRPGKYKGSQNVNLQCGYLKDDVTRVYPATILMCCFPRPTTAPCPLLEHRQIVSLFHELGHGIHDLVSKTSYTAFHGHRVPTDFGEAPSVMLENWCWLQDELRKMSCHYTKLGPSYLKKWQETYGDQIPPDTLPDAMLDGLIQSRDLNRGLWFLRQLACARFGMAVHHHPDHQSCEEIDPTSVYNDLMEDLMALPHPNPVDRGHPHADFSHVVSGYDAGYYSYLSAHVFAADLFYTAFAQDPRNKTAWETYRCEILEPGESKDELTMLETFLGHAPDPSVLLQTFDSAQEAY